jgi:predicted ATPase
MITSITLGNVRIFDGEPKSLRLPRLSVLCGVNSAGKSTILKSLLAIRQSTGPARTFGSTAAGKLKLSGPDADLGSFTSLVSHNDVSRPMILGVSIEDSMSTSMLQELTAQPLKSLKPRTQTSTERMTTYSLDSRFTFRLLGNDPETQSALQERGATQARLDSFLSKPQPLLESALFILSVGGTPLIDWEVKLSPEKSRLNRRKSPVYEVFLPVGYCELMEKSFGLKFERSEDGNRGKAKTNLRGLLPDSILIRRLVAMAEGKELHSKTISSHWPLPPLLYQAIVDLDSALNNINYLGPLRSPAKRYYITQSDMNSNLDSEGEFLPYVLRDHPDRRVWTCHPLGRDSEPSREPLLSSLNEWMYYLRTGEATSGLFSGHELLMSATNEVVVEFKLRSCSEGESHALADSGFGYSQVLPIIVRGLLTPLNGTLIVEQPELHLNPALQVRLAEFFVAMALIGKQILIETHSEHIVNAIRVATAEDSSGSLAPICGIFFFDNVSGAPHIHELSVNPDGTVPEWPISFFGEAVGLSGRLLRAQRRFRNTKEGNG